MRNTDGMLCTLKSDLFKLKKHKSIWIGLVLMFVLILFAYCAYWLGLSFLTKAEFPSDLDQFITQQQFIKLGLSNLTNFSEVCGLTLFVAIIACLFIGKDFSNGAIRLCVSRGANRVHLYFSKWISLAMLTIAYSVIAIIVCGIFTAIKGYGETFTAHHFRLLIRCFVLQTLCNLSTMSIVVMLAFLCRSSGSSLGATIGGAIVISLIAGLITGLGSLGSDSSWIYFMPLQQNSVAGLTVNYNAAQLCAVIIMPIVYGAIATAIGLISFLKRDIK